MQGGPRPELPEIHYRDYLESIKALEKPSIQEIANSHMIKRYVSEKPIVSLDHWDLTNSPTLSMLDRIISIPTSSQYRLLESYSYSKKFLGDIKGLFMIGDGYGGSSILLSRLVDVPIITSNLISPETAVPQLYGESSPPEHLWLRLTNINNKAAIGKENNILNGQIHGKIF